LVGMRRLGLDGANEFVLFNVTMRVTWTTTITRPVLAPFLSFPLYLGPDRAPNEPRPCEHHRQHNASSSTARLRRQGGLPADGRRHRLLPRASHSATFRLALHGQVCYGVDRTRGSPPPFARRFTPACSFQKVKYNITSEFHGLNSSAVYASDNMSLLHNMSDSKLDTRLAFYNERFAASATPVFLTMLGLSLVTFAAAFMQVGRLPHGRR
jgi:hypothetical protein